MKEITKKQLEVAIQEALEEGRDWCRLDTSHCYQIKMDISDGSIWVDLLDENHWKVYRDDSIVTLYKTASTIKEMEAGYLEAAIIKLTAAGWVIK